MKKITLIFILLTGICYSQNSQEERAAILKQKKETAKLNNKKKFHKFKAGEATCEDLVIMESELEGITKYSLPGEKYNKNIEITRVKTLKDDNGYITFNVKANNCSGIERGIFIKFSDGEILRYEKETVKCNYTLSGFILSGTLKITSELYNKISVNEIVQFSLSGTNMILKDKHPEDFMTLFKCMFEDLAKSSEIKVKEERQIPKDTIVNLTDAEEKEYKVKLKIYCPESKADLISTNYNKLESAVKQANLHIMYSMKNKYTYVPKKVNVLFMDDYNQWFITITCTAQNDYGATKDKDMIAIYDKDLNYISVN